MNYLEKLMYEIKEPKGTPLQYDEFKKYEIPPSFKRRSMVF